MRNLIIMLFLSVCLVLTGCFHYKHKNHHKKPHGVIIEEEILRFQNQNMGASVDIATPSPAMKDYDDVASNPAPKEKAPEASWWPW